MQYAAAIMDNDDYPSDGWKVLADNIIGRA
jgi:hypothetical protein